jgi:hypothetical protein
MSAKRPVPSKARSAFADFPAYTRAIGLATGEMAVLENLLGRMMAAAMRIEPRLGEIVYLSSHTPFGRLATLDVAASSVLPAQSPALERVKAVAKRGRELLLAQHHMASDIWTQVGAARRPKAKDIAAHTVKLTTHAAAIRNLANDVRKVTGEVKRARR